jgi:hypothetical protein
MAEFTGPAAAKFGADEVLDAYCEIGDFFYSYAVTNLTAPRPSYAAGDLAFVKAYMNGPAKRNWDKIVASAVRGDEKGISDVNALIYFNLKAVTKLGYTFPSASGSVPMMAGGSVSKATTEVLPATKKAAESLGMQFTVLNKVVVSKDGKNYYFPVKRRVSVSLERSRAGGPEHDWLIDSWNTKWGTRNKPLPLT